MLCAGFYPEQSPPLGQQITGELLGKTISLPSGAAAHKAVNQMDKGKTRFN